jgi:hypothetical protein
MVPELTTCEQCGRTVIVLSWERYQDDAAALMPLEDQGKLEIDCKIDCPVCGTRTQTVEFAAD